MDQERIEGTSKTWSKERCGEYDKALAQRLPHFCAPNEVTSIWIIGDICRMQLHETIHSLLSPSPDCASTTTTTATATAPGPWPICETCPNAPAHHCHTLRSPPGPTTRRRNGYPKAQQPEKANCKQAIAPFSTASARLPRSRCTSRTPTTAKAHIHPHTPPDPTGRPS